MEFKRSVLKLNVYGEEMELRFPTVREYRDFDKEVTKNKKPQDVLTVEFLEKLGFKKGLAEELEPAHLTDIINALTGNAEKK